VQGKNVSSVKKKKGKKRPSISFKTRKKQNLNQKRERKGKNQKKFPKNSRGGETFRGKRFGPALEEIPKKDPSNKKKERTESWGDCKMKDFPLSKGKTALEKRGSFCDHQKKGCDVRGGHFKRREDE